MTAGLRITVPDHVLTRELDGELVLLNLDTEKYLGLDEVGTAVWRALVETGSVDAAVEALLVEFDVSRERLERDVADLIVQLEEHGLVHTRDASTA